MWWHSFKRSQIAAFLATVVDYGILTTWVEVFHLYYSYGVALGSAFGAAVNFLLNRYWSFGQTEDHWYFQAFRYAMVASGCLILTTTGVYVLTEYLGIYYLFSQVCVSIVIAISYNYPLHRFFVYKKKGHYDQTIHFSASQSEN